MHRTERERSSGNVPLYHDKNKKNTPDRLERKKYNPFLKKVTVHREIK